LNNKLDIRSLNIQDKTVEQLPAIEKSAHRTEVRCLAFSSDDMLIASGSGESLKIWNRFVENCRVMFKSRTAILRVMVGINRTHSLSYRREDS
jgi:U3 small nucleolar RNA-associated protein 12